MEVLAPQVQQFRDQVELIILADDGEKSTGSKRNRGLEMAGLSDYVAAIDDDDLVSESYVVKTLEALKSDPDCVGWRMKRFSNGTPIGEGIHSIECKKYWTEQRPDGSRIYHRTPNHLNPIRTELARKVGFPDQSVAEDHVFAAQIFPHLKSEVFIDDYLYSYFYRTPLNREEMNIGSEAVAVVA